ncbi:MAG: hypothetical protein KatS3mg105_2182 [Gemmatales bacterium]|nr:MAG: hypothetical protein KatS3mg105_2182 [Gemmatales bacterium]
MQKAAIESVSMLVYVVVCAFAIGYVVYVAMGVFRPAPDPWPPRDAKEESEIIAYYKKMLQISDNPLTPRPPGMVALYISRIIDFDLKNNDVESARRYIDRAISQKLDGQVLKLVACQKSKNLIKDVRAGIQKLKCLKDLADRYQNRPGEKATKREKEKFDADFKSLADTFIEIPFDRVSTPDYVEKIGEVYKRRLAPAKNDPRLKPIVEHIEMVCLGQK